MFKHICDGIQEIFTIAIVGKDNGYFYIIAMDPADDADRFCKISLIDDELISQRGS